MDESPLTAADLRKFEPDVDDALGNDMIATAWVRARRIAPCITEDDFEVDNADDVQILKDVMRGAILRWYDRGSGAQVQRNTGEYGETLRAGDTNLYRPGEVRDLASLCSNYRKRGKASTILTGPFFDAGVQHAEWCSFMFVPWPNPEPQFCDCGAILTASGQPLYPPPAEEP